METVTSLSSTINVMDALMILTQTIHS